MKIDELIEELEQVKEEHGNLEVQTLAYGYWHDLEGIEVNKADQKVRF